MEILECRGGGWWDPAPGKTCGTCKVLQRLMELTPDCFKVSSVCHRASTDSNWKYTVWLDASVRITWFSGISGTSQGVHHQQMSVHVITPMCRHLQGKQVWMIAPISALCLWRSRINNDFLAIGIVHAASDAAKMQLRSGPTSEVVLSWPCSVAYSAASPSLPCHTWRNACSIQNLRDTIAYKLLAHCCPIFMYS